MLCWIIDLSSSLTAVLGLLLANLNGDSSQLESVPLAGGRFSVYDIEQSFTIMDTYFTIIDTYLHKVLPLFCQMDIFVLIINKSRRYI